MKLPAQFQQEAENCLAAICHHSLNAIIRASMLGKQTTNNRQRKYQSRVKRITELTAHLCLVERKSITEAAEILNTTPITIQNALWMRCGFVFLE